MLTRKLIGKLKGSKPRTPVSAADSQKLMSRLGRPKTKAHDPSPMSAGRVAKRQAMKAAAAAPRPIRPDVGSPKRSVLVGKPQVTPPKRRGPGGR